jgi:surface carbohydrate biosynthesis protein (TIGR04326 family)
LATGARSLRLGQISMTATLTIFDVDHPTLSENEVGWRNYAQPEDGRCLRSVPALVEREADWLRAKFLEWIFSVSSARLGSLTIAEHLLIRPDLSYWWMTPASHLPNLYEASWIDDAVKCLALEGWIRDSGFRGTINLVTHNECLAAVLANLCEHLGISFGVVAPSGMSTAAARTGHRFEGRAAAHRSALKSLIERKFLGPMCAAHGDLCVFDHLTYLDPAALESGRFQSAYWGTLIGLLGASGARVNWIHNLLPHAAVPTVAAARAVLSGFNQTGQGRHWLVEDAGSVSIGVRALRDWAALRRKAKLLRHADWRRFGSPPGSKLDFSPWLVPMLCSSLAGPGTFRQCVRLGMLERICELLPHQPIGIYIQENQPWEMALLHAWRGAGHGKIYGVQHSTVRYWDLRNFYAPASYSGGGPTTLPRPDAVAVNGPLAQAQYFGGGYPPDEVVRVEATRYPHLFGHRASTGVCANQRRVLVCGDNIPGANERLLRIVADASLLLPPGTLFRFRSHPAALFGLGAWEKYGFESASGSFPDLLREADCVVTGQTTSASLEAACAGARVAVYRDASALNTSPLRGAGIDCFFSTAQELASLISAPAAASRGASDYFDLDASLPGWRALLGLRDKT